MAKLRQGPLVRSDWIRKKKAKKWNVNTYKADEFEVIKKYETSDRYS